MSQYYSIPIRTDQLISGKKLEEIEVRQSIHQNIRLIVKSLSLSYSFDPTFGCVLNKFHARTPPQRKSERAWRESMREDVQKNLKDLLQRYESRVTINDVVVTLQEPGEKEKKAVVKVKVEIQGYFNLGRKEKFYYPDSEIAEEALEVFPLVIPVGKS